MKVCIIQPEYSMDYLRSDELFEKQLKMMESCDESMDIIVMPESCDVPALAKTREDSEKSSEKYNARLLKMASETAKRCSAILFLNARDKSEKGLRNTTFAFNRQGELVGKYFKRHLVPSETAVMHLDSSYSYEFGLPPVIEIEGIRFGFLTCYDFYFYEAFAGMARMNLDVIIGCSHQRSDTHRALEILTQFLAYNTNTHVIRASVSMGEDSPVGGGSMVVAPTGEVLTNMFSRIGMATAEIDPHNKYYKPAGFGNPPSSHYEYIEKGRHPWLYRPGGSAIVLSDFLAPYPRKSSSGSFSSLEKASLPAFAATVSMDIDEIAFKLCNKNGELMVESNAVTPFSSLLKKLSCHTIMNIDVSALDLDSISTALQLIRTYDCEKYVYFTSPDEKQLSFVKETAPHIPLCLAGASAEDLPRAVKLGCAKFFLPAEHLSDEVLDLAHKNGLVLISRNSPLADVNISD